MKTFIHRYPLFVVLAAICVACASPTPGVEAQPIEDPDAGVTTSWRERAADLGAPIAARSEAARTALERDDCFVERADAAGCEWSRYQTGPQYVEYPPDAESVLVIDALDVTPQFLRDRERFLGYYEAGPDGSIAERPVSFDLPRTLGDVLGAFAKRPYIPAHALAELAEPASIYVPHLTLSFMAHGLVVYDVLTDLIPNHPLVMLDDSLFAKRLQTALCELQVGGNGAVDASAIRAQSEQFAGSLRRLIAAHNVCFINVSWGHSLPSLRRSWEKCATPVPGDETLRSVLAALQPMYEALFASEGVLTVQAATTFDDPALSPLDVARPDFPNRLRAGVYTAFGDDLPREGAAAPQPGWSPSPSNLAMTDVLINSGITRGRQRQRGYLASRDYFGFGTFPLDLKPQSSFLAPVALARVIAARSAPPRRGRPMTNQLIRELLLELTCRTSPEQPAGCAYWDPLWHRQFETSELGDE